MDCLSGVDKREDWYTWILFFLKGLEEQSKLAFEIGLNINDLFKKSRSKIENETAGINLIKVLEYTFSQPYLTVSRLHLDTNIPASSCERYLQKLARKEVIKDLGIHNKKRVYVNSKLMQILNTI